MPAAARIGWRPPVAAPSAQSPARRSAPSSLPASRGPPGARATRAPEAGPQRAAIQLSTGRFRSRRLRRAAAPDPNASCRLLRDWSGQEPWRLERIPPTPLAREASAGLIAGGDRTRKRGQSASPGTQWSFLLALPFEQRPAKGLAAKDGCQPLALKVHNRCTTRQPPVPEHTVPNGRGPHAGTSERSSSRRRLASRETNVV